MHRLKIIVACGALLAAVPTHAQSRVGSDSATRTTRLGHDLLYGSVEGLAFAGLDQLRNDPVDWGKGWRGYEKRAASNLGEFYIQGILTEGLAAAMNRPLDYKRCTCAELDDRVASALRGAVTDQMPNGSHPIAIPRIVGAYAGSFAQAMWRPASLDSRVRVGVVNGTTSLAVGALINLYREVRR